MEFALADAEPKPVFSVGVPGLGLKGLVEGVGREVLGSREDGINPPDAVEGENRDGNVPARVRRVVV